MAQFEGCTIFPGEIKKSPNDGRKYRHITLNNGLEALLCEDKETDKAAAALTVAVGHLNDPDEIPGLAHFCEHLLFMGTKRFPSENEYKRFLKQHSGSSNASTDFGKTTYEFDVSPSALEGAIERFSQFFVAPLFDESCVDREVKAVHSEFLAKYQMDDRRNYVLGKSTASPNHPYRKFATGNLSTLQRPDIRSKLLEWYPKHYSANLMRLAIVSTRSLDQLTNLVVREFKDVENRGLERSVFGGSALEKEQLKKVIYNRSIKDIRQVSFQFPIPDQYENYETNPRVYLAHFIGYEGPGSLFDFLKKKGWVDYIYAQTGNVSARGFDLFSIGVTLTAEGLLRHADVIQTIFSYLDFLCSHPPSESSFVELKQMADTTFRFKEKSQPYNYVQFLVSRMLAAGPKEAVIRNGTCLGEWFPEQVAELADFLKRDNCRIMISSKQEPDGVKYDSMEERYQIEYTTVEMDDVLAKASETIPSDAFEMLPPNPFIPKDFEIKGPIPTSPSPKPPSVVIDNKSLKLWHKLDDQWGVPKGVIHVRIRNPNTDRTPKEAVKTSMVFSLFSDHVQRKFYDAILAGHSYSLSTDQDNIHIKVKGYNEKLPALLMQLVEEIKVFQPTTERFGIVMDWHERSYKNFALRRPDTLASTFMNYLLAEVSWLPSEALNQLQDVTLEEVHSHISELLKGSRTEMMLHGNFSTHEAKVLAEQFTGAVPGDGSDNRNPHRTYLLPEQGCNFVYQLPGLDAANVNSAIDFRVQVCLSTSFLERAKLQLIGQILSEPVFDQLRTKEQLGYIVHGSTNLHVGVMGYSITIQSEKSAGYLEERIEAFYDMMVERLEQMSEEEMEKNKQSLIEDLLEKDKNMYEEISNHWRRITEGYCDFEKYERDAKLIKKLTKFDILSFFKKHFLRSSTSRRKLSVQILSQTVHDDDPIMSTLQSQLPHPALEEIEKFVKTRPPIIKVEEKVIQVFDEHGIPVEGRQGFTNLMKKLKEPPSLLEGVKLVRDAEINEWQSTLKKGPIPEPLLKEHLEVLEAKL